MTLRAAAFALPLWLFTTAGASAEPSSGPEPKTAAAVEAADAAWGAAEESGDKAFVEWLLLPGYRSIGDSGKPVSRETIVSHVSAERGAQRKAAVAAWRAAHAERPDTTIFGDTAVLAWTSTLPGEPVYSCDVFVYRDGHWRAIYSQHTTAGA